MFCPKCGKELKPGVKFCGGCGAPTEQVSSEYGNTAAPKQAPGGRPKKKKGLWAGSLVVLFLLLFSGGFAAYKQGMLDSLIDSTPWGYDGGKEREERREAREKRRQEGEEDRAATTTAAPEAFTETENSMATTEAESSMAITEAEITAAFAGAMETTASYYSSSGGSGYSTSSPNYYSYTPPPTTAPSYTYRGYDNSYMIPNSSYSRLTEADLAGYTKEQLKIARNEIYARHGRRFDTEALQNYFNTKSWYSGTIAPSSFSEDLLSQVEKDNIKLIKKKEDSIP